MTANGVWEDVFTIILGAFLGVELPFLPVPPLRRKLRQRDLRWIVAETQLALTGLPSDVPIIVGLSARDRGETAVVEAAIVVP